MNQTVLSLAPLPAELVKFLIGRTQGVPDFEVIAGHEMSDEEIKKYFFEANVVLGDIHSGIRLPPISCRVRGS